MTDNYHNIIDYAIHNSNEMANYLLWKEAIWSIRHPNKVMFRSYRWTAIGDEVVPIGMLAHLQNERWKHGYVRGILALPDLSETDLAKEIKKALESDNRAIPKISMPLNYSNEEL